MKIDMHDDQGRRDFHYVYVVINDDIDRLATIAQGTPSADVDGLGEYRYFWAVMNNNEILLFTDHIKSGKSCNNISVRLSQKNENKYKTIKLLIDKLTENNIDFTLNDIEDNLFLV